MRHSGRSARRHDAHHHPGIGRSRRGHDVVNVTVWSKRANIERWLSPIRGRHTLRADGPTVPAPHQAPGGGHQPRQRCPRRHCQGRPQPGGESHRSASRVPSHGQGGPAFKLRRPSPAACQPATLKIHAMRGPKNPGRSRSGFKLTSIRNTGKVQRCALDVDLGNLITLNLMTPCFTQHKSP